MKEEKPEDILLKNIDEFVKKAKEASQDKAYNSAVTLYFKAIAVIIDLFLLRKEGFIPSNHSERFRILETKYPFLYEIMDKDFPTYQQSYKLRLTEGYCDVLENDLKKVAEFTKTEISS